MTFEPLRRRVELERMMGVDAVFRKRGVTDELKELEREHARECHNCRLREGAEQVVFARGSARSKLMFVGEAPGAEEDRQGLPFVGRAGRLLDRMIFAMGLERDSVYITNIVKCRPPDNREPRVDEVEACMPYLRRQVELVQPEVICTLGRPAANSMLNCSNSMGELRGKWTFYDGVALLPTYHPAYLLRSPSRKKHTWHDLKKVILALAEGAPEPRGEGLF